MYKKLIESAACSGFRRIITLRTLTSSTMVSSSNAIAESGPMQQSIVKKLEEALTPSSLSIVNESHKHAGHAGNPNKDGDKNAETHFRIELVSQAFEGKSLVQRHRMVYQLLSDELNAGLHALALKTTSPAELKLQNNQD
jgi:stress-induced morphogen